MIVCNSNGNDSNSNDGNGNDSIDNAGTFKCIVSRQFPISRSLKLRKRATCPKNTKKFRTTIQSLSILLRKS